MATVLEIIKGALRRINSYQTGETIAAPDQNDCLETFNDLLDSWSTSHLHIFGSNESILQWVNGKNQYKIGNPFNTDLGLPAFTGTVAIGLNTITGITNLPSGLVVGSTITDVANVIPPNTTVTAIAGTTVTMSANATATPPGVDSINYTLPGDFAIARPLRITGGFTRINELDFWLDVYTTQEQYTSILFKPQPGPWPTVAWYNLQFPYGILNVYQTPGMNAELHLFTDTILSRLTINQTIIFPQGYVRALKWCLAQEICAEYGFPLSEAIKKNAYESLAMIKAANAQPPQRAKYDRILVRGNRPDGSWITDGGMGR